MSAYLVQHKMYGARTTEGHVHENDAKKSRTRIKVHVTLVSIRRDTVLAELATHVAVRPNQLSEWTQQSTGTAAVFDETSRGTRQDPALAVTNTMTTDFCLEAVQEALAAMVLDHRQHRLRRLVHQPGIHGAAEKPRIQICIDGTDCWRDIVFVGNGCGVA